MINTMGDTLDKTSLHAHIMCCVSLSILLALIQTALAEEISYPDVEACVEQVTADASHTTACLEKSVALLDDIIEASGQLSDELTEMRRENDALKQKVLELTPNANEFANIRQEQLTRYRSDFLDHQREIMTHKEKVFARQRTSGNVILSVVIILVLTGVAFAVVQFYFMMKLHKETPSGLDKAMRVEFEVSKDKMFVNTGFIGFAIIALSFVFFLSYLILIYPINNISNKNTSQQIERPSINSGE